MDQELINFLVIRITEVVINDQVKESKQLDKEKVYLEIQEKLEEIGLELSINEIKISIAREASKDPEHYFGNIWIIIKSKIREIEEKSYAINKTIKKMRKNRRWQNINYKKSEDIVNKLHKDLDELKNDLTVSIKYISALKKATNTKQFSQMAINYQKRYNEMISKIKSE